MVGGDFWEGDSLTPQHLLPPPWSPLQSEAKWATQMSEMEKERAGLVQAMACREEELAALREQLKVIQLKLGRTQASNDIHLG